MVPAGGMARAVTASAAAAPLALLFLALLAAAPSALAQSRGGHQGDGFFHDDHGWHHWGHGHGHGGHGHHGGHGGGHGHKKPPPPAPEPGTFEPTPSPVATPPPAPPPNPPESPPPAPPPSPPPPPPSDPPSPPPLPPPAPPPSPPSPPPPPPPKPPSPSPPSPPPPSPPPPPPKVCPRRDEYLNKKGKCKKCRDEPVQIGPFTCFNLESLLSTSKKCVPIGIPAFCRRHRPGGRRRLSQASSIATCISPTEPSFDVVLATQSAQQPALQGADPESAQYVKGSLRLADSITPSTVTPAANGNAVASFSNNGGLSSYRGGVVRLTGVVIIIIDGRNVYVCFQSFLRVCR